MAEISNELGKTEQRLFSALHENEGLRAQIHTLRAKNEQLITQLWETQRLANTLKSFVDQAVKESVDRALKESVDQAREEFIHQAVKELLDKAVVGDAA